MGKSEHSGGTSTDEVLTAFLRMLANDLDSPGLLLPVDAAQHARIASLVAGVELDDADLMQPLPDEDPTPG